MYATTKEFLDYFSLKSLDELPTLDAIREIDDANQNLDLINAEKNASVTREYDFDNEGDVEIRGEEVLAETELELEEAQRLVQQVEDNVFNKPSEEELAAEREAEREAKAAEERLAEEAATERKLADKYAQSSLSVASSSSQPSFADMANKAQQRLSSETDSGLSVADLADKIADHQARLAGSPKVEEAAEVEHAAEAPSTEAPTEDESSEGLTLIQQQERLMQQLMQEEAERQARENGAAETETITVEPSVSNTAADTWSYASDNDSESESESYEDEALLAEAQAEKELLEQERLENEQLEKQLLEKERLAEEALENELSLEDDTSASSSTVADISTKKNSLFDD
jgi:segregation and condensation protein B